MSRVIPTEVTIREVGPREGLQTSNQPISAKSILELITLLSESGISEVEVASMIRNDKVPSMNIADDICKGVSQVSTSRYSALYLNEKGFQRALQFPQIKNGGWIQTAVSETFLSKNANTSFEKNLSSIDSLVNSFQHNNIPLEGVMLSCVFGCHYEGNISTDIILQKVNKIISTLRELKQELPLLVLADTAGLGSPDRITEVITAIGRAYPKVRLGLHLHDTRGLGIANAYAGLQCGVDYFDSSVAGVGGCPFMTGASGNIATEELVFLCHELGIKTGVNFDLLLKASRFAGKIFGSQVSSRLLKASK
jgi:hydroxymethylglutaryl-CoA lyase